MLDDYKYKRVLLKISGEALAGDQGYGIDPKVVDDLAEEILPIVKDGVQLAVVVGGGNIFRGLAGSAEGMDRAQADYIGMLATVMNALYVSEVFRSAGMKTAVFGAFEIPGMMPVFDKDEVEKAFADRCVVFFAGGTGHPYFSTDTGTALRAVEIEADVILLAKAVDGVYSADPKTDPDAKRYDSISISEVVAKGLKVIDLTASVLCMENRLPLAVFSLNRPGNIADALNGHIDGTIVTAE